MKEKSILKDAKEILALIPEPSGMNRYHFIFEINTTIKKLTNTFSTSPYISLIIRDKDEIIIYISANLRENDYNNKVSEIKEKIITYKKLNNDRNN